MVSRDMCSWNRLSVELLYQHCAICNAFGVPMQDRCGCIEKSSSGNDVDCLIG